MPPPLPKGGGQSKKASTPKNIDPQEPRPQECSIH